MIRKPWKFDSFHLKIIALVTMLIDHCGVIIVGAFWPGSIGYSLLRIIGRIAFPLFAFMIAEGVLHTKKPWAYLLRLLLMAILIGVSIYVVNDLLLINVLAGNIFIDLVLGGSIIFALRQKKYWKMTAIIPIGIATAIFLLPLPEFLKMDYQLYGVTMIVGFYLARLLGNWYLRRQTTKMGVNFIGFTLSPQYQTQLNLYACIWLLSINLIWYIMFLIDANFVNLAMGAQTYSFMAALFIYAYTGRRGYNAKWFQYGSYAFYPLHFLVLYGIYELIAALIH
jgi:hypothetical protein